MTTIALRSSRTLTPTGERPALVVIENGRIADVLPPDAVVNCPVTDLGDAALLPGLIDPHVHLNEPGRTHWEGFDTGTRAALAGGLTTLVDMPLNSSPVTTTVANFQEKLAAARSGHLHTNAGFWGGVVPGNANEIEPLIETGVLGFKAFLTHSGIDDFPNATEADLQAVMPVLARHGLPLLVHCELSEDNSAHWARGDVRSYAHYLASRPAWWETDAIALMIRLCRETGCRTHIVHLATAEALPMLAAARAEGLPLTVETGQHYLFFSAEEIPDGATQYKCAPPIRTATNREALWEGLREGVIDFVATDHSPAPPNLKQLDSGDFSTAWGGIASLQLALPVLWTAARDRGFELADVARWLSAAPARLAGLDSRKGRIEKGFDADLVVFDPEATFTVDAATLFHRHPVSPYHGRELRGVVERTLLAGETVYARPAVVATNRGAVLLGR
ncbi:MAG: allantoinase AllB [Hymenobacteraceae bacterium]|nr:allantoinase AllB [Hymenobacteraceae bacterium]